MQVTRTGRRRKTSSHPLATPRGLSANTGPIASAAWLAMLELYPKEPKWHAVATLGTAAAGTTSFRIEIYAEEWGFVFDHGERRSWIRITDVPFVHGRDDHELLRRTPPLRELGRLVRALEQEHALCFEREAAAVATTIDGGQPVIRRWIESL